MSSVVFRQSDGEMPETRRGLPGGSGSPKERVYIFEFNTPSSRNLMPLAAGLLYSYALNIPSLRERFDFRIEIARHAPERVVAELDNPGVIALSVYFWNFNQSIQTARLAKARFPDALIVFGGPSVPLYEEDTRRFFAENPYVDVIVPGEGEILFSEILTSLAERRDLAAVAGISVKTASGAVTYQSKGPYLRDVSVLPSPFLNGVFDDLLNRHRSDITGVVLETNRGCPFTCTFCYWGALGSKVSPFPLDRVYAELDWISRNRIAYIYGADANFGILPRDREIAAYVAKLNRETGYPKYFVINWTKNTTDRIFDIIAILNESNIQFMVTTSVQSFNEATLAAVRRRNIRFEHFHRVLEETQKQNFHSYTELILGLPLETYESFIDGIRKVLLPELHFHFYIYCCVLIPGAEMSNPEYIAKYRIETRRCVMNVLRAVHSEDTTPEYEDLVVGTSAMPVHDWKRAHRFGYFTKALYGFRVAFFLVNYLRETLGVDPIELVEFIIDRAEEDPSFATLRRVLSVLNDLEDSILNDGNWTARIREVDSSLLPDVAALIAILSDKVGFYSDLEAVIEDYLELRDLSRDEEVYREVFLYQFVRVPSWHGVNLHRVRFHYNVHEHFVGKEALDRSGGVLVAGDGAVFENADELLNRHLRRGMAFSLLDVRRESRTHSDVPDAATLFTGIIRPSMRENGEREALSP